MLPLPRDESFVYWDYWVKQFAFEDVKLPYTLSENLNIFLNFDLADELFQGALFSFSEILDLEAAGAIRSFPLNARASFTGSFKERDFIGENIAEWWRAATLCCGILICWYARITITWG